MAGRWDRQSSQQSPPGWHPCRLPGTKGGTLPPVGTCTLRIICSSSRSVQPNQRRPLPIPMRARLRLPSVRSPPVSWHNNTDSTRRPVSRAPDKGRRPRCRPRRRLWRRSLQRSAVRRRRRNNRHSVTAHKAGCSRDSGSKEIRSDLRTVFRPRCRRADRSRRMRTCLPYVDMAGCESLLCFPPPNRPGERAARPAMIPAAVRYQTHARGGHSAAASCRHGAASGYLENGPVARGYPLID